MRKWIAMSVCVLVLAACGGGNNTSSNNNGSNNAGNNSACSSAEAPELKGLKGAELDAMKAAVTVRDKLKDLKKRSAAATDNDARKKLMDELDKMEPEAKKAFDQVDKLDKDVQAKFDAIKEEIHNLGESIEDDCKPK